MTSKERGVSPSEQILQADHAQKLKKIKETGALKGKVFLFERSHAAYDPATGLIEIIRSRSAEKEVEKNLVETKFGPVGQMELPIAIAHVLHIVDDFQLAGGEITESDRSVLNKALEMLEWWDETPISEDDRQIKEREVAELLESTNYASARDRHRQKINTELRRGSKRDSLDRINPEAMKVLVAVAIRSGNRREDKNRIIFKKYGLQLLPDLIIEREGERKRLHQAMIRIDQVLRTPERFLNSYKKKVKTLTNDLAGILNPWVVKLAPFTNPSTEILAILVPNLYGRNRKRIKQILGETAFDNLRLKAVSLSTAVKALDAYPKDARASIDTLLKTANVQLAETLRAEQAQMDEELEKRRIRLTNRT